jgi:hypothetical protein
MQWLINIPYLLIESTRFLGLKVVCEVGKFGAVLKTSSREKIKIKLSL